MGKMKTKKAAAKRVKVTGSGRLLRRRRMRNKHMSQKTAKRKRRLKLLDDFKGKEEKKVRRLVPYA